MAEKTNRTTVSPFNRPSEDVILRSSDGLELYVNKWVLKDASTVFADMFDVPQPPATDHGSIQVADGALPDAKPPPSDNTPPVIPVSEDGNTLEQLLKLCYPLSVSPTFLTFDSVKPVLVAAHKYHIDHALELVRPRLQHFSRTQPVHVYAFAARYGMTTLMEDAARDFLMLPDMWAYASELDGVSGTEYHRLLMYRNRCAATLKDLIATPLRTYFPDPDAWIWLTCSSCRKHRCGDGKCVPECKEAAWFRAHWDKLGTLLHATPALDAIRDPKLTEEPMKEAVTCSTCRNKVFRHMRRFSELFFAEVELRLSKILLDDVLR
ncbi:hypothetical protein L226DRAFT_614227 [Lentinus tigrinus ALCF2SS1-7]|uniref:BTB domain-containing protein n=1 Tax=Lentinus tigrinus ALCF2SS1-6 TaxID=1328759 RepID=A0A5C2S6S3_9APHY|nr:hypothetical protein L227DRAFT_654379 [Lentinus tigrinus ALCF2SS1-6]RPD73328.1 hypothetical protein L226DRAFT_614227 [Lentinus tigrinus ALCF2SS1-7]